LHPAFRSRGAILASIAVNLVFLALPFVVGALVPKDRPLGWASLPIVQGSIANDVRVLYRDSADADILLLGPSTLHVGLLLPELRAAMTKKLGRPAKVESIIVYGQGVDWTYFALRDFLLRHKSTLVLVADPLGLPQTVEPHRHLPRILRYGVSSEVFQGISGGSRIQVLSSFVLGGPRQLLSCVRPDRIGSDEKVDGFVNVAYRNFLYSGYAGKAFKELPVRPSLPPEIGYWTGDSSTLKVEASLGAYQVHFLSKMVELFRGSSTNLAFIHVNGLDEAGRSDLPEAVDYKKLVGGQKAVIGLPMTKIFPGLDRTQLEDYFSDAKHMNLNGSRIFTTAITPSILAAYDAAVDKETPRED